MNALAQIDTFERVDRNPGASELVPRATAELIVRQRNTALARYEEAHRALIQATDLLQNANAAVRAIHGRENRFNYHLHGEKTKFMHVRDVQGRDEYMARAHKIVDTEAWAHIVDATNLERLMDKEAKDKLHQQLLSDPPEATIENIYATLEQFMLDADMIFRRGIANCFSKLDRRFRSHDGFKIGSRVILDRMYDGYGFSNYKRDMESVLMDIERTFMVLDGREVPPSYGSITGLLGQSRYTGRGPRQGVVQNEFFKVCVYKNGNAHVWFKRDDLVEKVNKLLAEYYGEVIPDGMTPEDDGGLFTPKTSLAKRFGFYPTPDDAAKSVIDKVSLHRKIDDPPLTILEPSAGTGNLARLCAAQRSYWEWSGDKRVDYHYRAVVDCVEIQAQLSDALRGEGIYRKVYTCDFLALQPETTGLYDRVVMNPPFDRERDIDHVIHAMKFLKPGGFLIAIMSAGTEFRETRKSIAFRKLMQEKKAHFRDLPPGSFSSVGTNVNTIVVSFWNDARNFYQ